MRFLIPVATCFLGLGVNLSDFVSAQESLDFNRDIRPILSDNCFACHGPDESTREADLRLDDEASAKMDRDDYQVISEKHPDQSELIARIFSNDDDVIMPPPEFEKKLTPNQKQLLKKWIQQGATWSRHWAFVPPVKHPVPVTGSPWAKSWIDHFILDRLQQKGLQPVDDADRTVWLRRIYFDLIGLPPTLEDVQGFLNDSAANAKQRVVDKLLASRHFGERMAIYWLDLVRYADTVGYHGDQDHNISPYRDWVIDAFNRNLPFDQFTIEQLAGDLLPDPGESQLVASGYNRLLQTTHEGGLQPSEYRAMYAADRVRNVSAVWMGGTLGCAQCHDHKYDPYTMKDFYSMSAFFADIDDETHFKNGTNSLPTRRDPEIRILSALQRQEIQQLRNVLQQLERDLANADNDETKQAIEKQRKKTAEQMAKIEKSGRLTMITKTLAEPRLTRILPRGDFLNETGNIVSPAFPEFLASGPPPQPGPRFNRLDLARWLTHSKSPSGLLTARVFVNRLWYLFYGTGLAPDLADFGGQGLPPNHPELLDNLAISFVQSDWNIKKLVKELVLTRTYQLSSVPSRALISRDPENHLFGRQNRYRMPAEMIRDNALAVSGLLVTNFGGPSVKPYQPAGYYRHLNFPPRRYAHDVDERQYQRGVYVHWQRQFLHPMFRAFDAPRREECTAERPTSNTPNAALVLLNDPTFVESARVFAARIVARENDLQKRISLAFEIALSRQPDKYESRLLTELFEASRKIYNSDAEAARKHLAIGLQEYRGEQDFAELASFAQVTRAILNLDEFVSRR